MAKSYINSDIENVEISMEAIAQFAGSQALECFGVVGMAAKSVSDGLMHLLKKESLTKGIDVTTEPEGLVIEFHIIVAYGLNVCTIAQNLMENVKYKVEEFTGLKVKSVNVMVEGVKVID